MNVLYLGRYKRRFDAVIALLEKLPSNSTVLELCFGDVYVAEYCRQTGRRWMGLDLNAHFVERAQQAGFAARYADVAAVTSLPRADVCVAMGSFYHFHRTAASMLAKMFAAADRVVISEPVRNLSSRRGLVGFLARRAANAGKGSERFRYDETSLTALLAENAVVIGYRVVTARRWGNDLVVELAKNADRDA